MRTFLCFTIISMSLLLAPNSYARSNDRQYTKDMISLSDFSYKITAYYESRGASVPQDFDAQKFFSLLGMLYPDQNRVRSVQDNYKISVRGIDGGYSIMLCDPTAGYKVMEDLSCNLTKVEYRTWQKKEHTPCWFETRTYHSCE